MIDTNLFEKKLSTSFGYGKWKSDIWFITMHDYYSTVNQIEVENELDKWKSLGELSLMDIHSNYKRTKNENLFYQEPKTICQSTWCALIKILYSYYEKIITEESIKNFQANNWGRKTNANYYQTYIDLLPIGFNSNGDRIWKWHNYEWTRKLPYMNSYETYKNEWQKKRIDELINKINEYSPQIVIFHSKTNNNKIWNNIAKCNFEQIKINEPENTICIEHKNNYLYAQFYDNKTTLFINIEEPILTVSDEYLEIIGEEILERIGHSNLGTKKQVENKFATDDIVMNINILASKLTSLKLNKQYNVYKDRFNEETYIINNKQKILLDKSILKWEIA